MSEPTDAIEFLKALHPSGPWVITAINPEQTGGRTETETFALGEEDGAQRFIHKWNGKWNLYFTHNRVGRKIRKKPERIDIEWLDHLHVDLDPNRWTEEVKFSPEEFIKEEQDRTLALLTYKLPAGVPRPTLVVFSGGGYQAFWKLAKPIKLDGTLDGAEDAKLYNVELERLFGADHCHNIDRIMRLPGTWNVPTPAKIKKGRTKVEAGIVYFDPEQVDDISQFNKAVKVQPKCSFNSTAGSPVEVDVIPGNIERMVDVHELDKHTADGQPIKDNIKRIIQLGWDDQDESADAKPESDRSVWVYHAACDLVRRGVPDQIIISVLLDKDFRISDHVYDQKQGAEKYAIRQIRRAKEAAIDPQLAELNDVHAVLLQEGGKTRVLSWETSELDANLEVPVLQSFEDFQKRYMNRTELPPVSWTVS